MIAKKVIPIAIVSMIMVLPFQSRAGFSEDSQSEKNKSELTDKKEENDSDSFKKSLAEAKVLHGLMDIYLKKDGKLFLALPDSIYGSDLMLVSRVNSISHTKDLVAGEMNVNPIVIRFTKDPINVYMHIVQDKAEINREDPIAASYNRNFIDPIVKGFKIKSTEDGKDFIEVTDFFKGNEKLISPIKDLSPIAMLLSGKKSIDATYYEDGSAITSVKAFPDNIMIESRLAYTTDKVYEPYTVSMARSIIKLPATPMKSRLQDNRVGYFYEAKKLYSSEIDGIKDYQIIDRFRLEPKEEDMGAYFLGQLAEPKQKIVFYVDSAFPDKWRGAVKEGIEYWNRGFEAAGFKNAIEARDYPKDDPTFDADDIRKNCVRYCVTPTANAMGPSYVDPRTGEILGADVIWYHNVLQLLHDWKFTQTGAVDPRVRTSVFPDSVMYESLTYVTAHEIGHCLGLMHNMGASYAYTIDNLRDPEFTQKYGTTPSIMDYARNNYVAQPGDFERGVKLTPPEIGVYDIHAINWGYRLLPGNPGLFEEIQALDSLIREHDGDPMYEFGAQQVLGLMDPTDQTEDLSNDHIGAGTLAISNLKIIMDHFEEWAGEPGENYENLEKKYMAVVNQFGRHIGHVIPYIGGVQFKEVRQGKGDGHARNYFSKADQQRAMQWLMSQIRDCGWLEPGSLTANFEEPPSWRRKIERSVVGCFTSPVVLGRIKKGYESDPVHGYKVEDFIDDAMAAVFDASYKNKSLDDTELNLQSVAILALAKASGMDNLNNVKLADSALDASDAFNEFVMNVSSPSLACSQTPDYNFGLDNQRAFYRIALGDNPLPQSEMKPLMTHQLQSIRTLYKKCVSKAPDFKTKEYYKYQLRILDQLLK
ncbi:MAG: zinc-dependent metalloprotease [Muribaculaceae bacterium]|nr:zinc-dependent metalloprotease [Muribaculaceae bacterium]